MDDDGKAGGGIPVDMKMSDAQVQNLKDMLEVADCEPDRLITFMDRAFGGKKGIPNIEALEHIPAKLYDDAMRQLLIFEKSTRQNKKSEGSAQ